jgi:hypothetical protein
MAAPTARVHARVHPCLHCGQGFESARVLNDHQLVCPEAKVRDLLGGM